MDATLVMVTAPSGETARALARALVKARLAASVNVAAGITSFYWWDGAVQEGAEALLFAKTRADLVDRAIDFVKARHPYDCPAIFALPIAAGNPDYLAWIGEETVDQA
jgi:periplasmic divalent cation tolerance protein